VSLNEACVSAREYMYIWLFSYTAEYVKDIRIERQLRDRQSTRTFIQISRVCRCQSGGWTKRGRTPCQGNPCDEDRVHARIVVDDISDLIESIVSVEEFSRITMDFGILKRYYRRQNNNNNKMSHSTISDSLTTKISWMQNIR
jgi:hypothetical protein